MFRHQRNQVVKPNGHFHLAGILDDIGSEIQLLQAMSQVVFVMVVPMRFTVALCDYVPGHLGCIRVP